MIRVNLQPKVIAEAKAGFQLPLWIPILLGLIAVAGCGSVWWFMNDDFNSKNSELKSLVEKLKDFESVDRDYQEVVEAWTYLEAKQKFVKGITTNQYQWVEFLDMFKSNIPTDVWVDSLKIKREGEFSVEGETYSYGAVANFMVHLTAMPQLKNVKLDGTGSKSTGGSGGGGQQGGSLQDSMTKIFKITGSAQLNVAQAAKPSATPAPPTSRTATP